MSSDNQQSEILDAEEFKSSAIIRGYWPGFPKLKHLVVFGDSYSDIGWNLEHSEADSSSSHPTTDRPLGVEFPGTTWTEGRLPNWVGHLIHMYKEPQLLVYDYAVGGADCSAVEEQMSKRFLHPNGLAGRPSWASWGETDTLFVTWVGINDVCLPWTGTSQLERVIKGNSQLYHQAGARNFMFINVPPRCKPVTDPPNKAFVSHHSKIKAWNQALETTTDRFREEHPEATVILYSAWALFCKVLNNPELYGFEEEDVHAYSAMWSDDIHPTSGMHEIIGVDLSEYLAECQAL